MENSANALLMAGGVLIGVMVLSLAVYLFVDLGGITGQMTGNIETSRIGEFNSQFLVYITDDNLSNQNIRTIQDIVTVAGYANEYNENYGDGYDENNENLMHVYIGVAMDITKLSYNSGNSQQYLLGLIDNDNYKDKYYRCLENDIRL